jgi:hypothetical protein
MVRSCSLVLVILSLACGPEAAPAPQATPPAKAPAAPEQPAEPVKAAPKAEPPAPVDDTGPLGVAACDEYIAAYRACVAELPEDTREHHTKVVDGQRKAWGQAKADTKRAAGLADGCTAARAAAKLALPDCKSL